MTLQDRKPGFDLIEPGGPRWCIVECDTWMALQPIFVLLVRIQIVEDDFEAAVGIGRDDFIHEVEKFLAAATFLMSRLDLAGGHFDGCEQRRGAI